MAQTKKKRRRKHRGTQGGRVDTGGKRTRPRNRQEARGQARKKQPAKKGAGGTNRLDQPPTWRSATIRGVVAAVLFVVLVVVIFQRPVSEALMFGAFMLLFYIPAGYYMDSFIWRRKERARIRAANAAREKKQRGEDG